MSGSHVVALAGALLLGLTAASALEQRAVPEVATGSVGLRAGHDGNPTSTKGAAGSPFLASSTTLDYLRGTLEDGHGATLTLGWTEYDPRFLDAGRSSAATLRHAFGLGDGVVQSSLAAADEQSWSRRKSSIAWRERIDHRTGAWRLFASAEARLTALNERNVFADGGFLPGNETFSTIGLTPGLAWREGDSEIGVSFSLARINFVGDIDYLGLRRGHDRMQPNLFASTALGGVTVGGSLSLFRAAFPDKDFETVSRLLYTAKASVPLGPVTLALASQRGIEDTTLPFSVINVTAGHEARLSAKLGEKDVLGLFGQVRSEDYVGLGARSTTRSLGLDYARTIGEGLAATAAVAVRRSKETGALPVDALTLQFGLQRQFELVRPAGKEPDPKPETTKPAVRKPAVRKP